MSKNKIEEKKYHKRPWILFKFQLKTSFHLNKKEKKKNIKKFSYALLLNWALNK